jgi:uncharacterized protein
MKQFFAAMVILTGLLSAAGAVWADEIEDSRKALYSGDYALALKLLAPRANQNVAWAQNGMGVLYQGGHGVTQDYTEAVKWYRKAAEQGYTKAQSNLGVMYIKGEGVPQDYREAAKWFRKAADQGLAESQFNLGICYENGFGVTQDYAEAMRWYRKAADQGYAKAQSNLGMMYKNGKGVTQDYTEAAKWYRMAADQRNAEAQKRLKEAEAKAAAASTQSAEKERQAAEASRKEEQRIAAAKREEVERQAAKAQSRQEDPPRSSGSGSGFFVSKLGHIVTNEHVVRNCGSVTVGANANKQVSATVLETDKRNDLALLKLSSIEMASADTKTLIQKLGLTVVPLSSSGLFRSDDIELGERLLVAGFPFGDLYSNTIKVTGGMVSAIRGMGDDSGQFQMDAAVQPGNSGGPIYDKNGSVVGVVVAQLNKMKVAKAIGSMPENVNFGIKASTVRQFLTSSGLPTKWSDRSEAMSTTDIAKIAKNQTVMVVCNR